MKKKIIFILIPIVAIIIILGVFLLLKFFNNNKSVGTTWGDTYYAYLKEAISQEDLDDAEEKFGIQLDMEDAKLQFCEVEADEDPSMIMTYSKDNNEYVNVYQIGEDDKVTYVAYKQPTTLELLYNIELKEYIWYICAETSEGVSYSSLKNIIKNLKNKAKGFDEDVKVAELEADYTFKKDEATTVETVDGDTLSILKFDQTFIKPEIEASEQIDFDIDIKEKDLKELITETVDGYKKQEKIITEEIKADVNKKVTEVETKLEEMETAKQEVEKKKEEEAKKVTNENLQEKLGDHIKWFSAAYLGTIYGWPSIYKYEEVTGTVTLPNAPEGAMIYELKGCNSINSIKTELAKYVSEDKFSKFEETSDFVKELTEYNGKVYWANLGVGDGPYISAKDAKVQSSENGVTKIVLYEKHAIAEMVSATITVTVEYKDSKYLITDWTTKSNY